MWRCDIARYSGGTAAHLCVNFSAILWQLAMQSCDAAQWKQRCGSLYVNFNATRCSGTCCGDVQILARFLFGDIHGYAQQRKSQFHLAIRLMQRQNHKVGCDFHSVARWVKVQCGAEMRSSDITQCNYDTAFCSALWRLKAFSVLKAARESERSRWIKTRLL